MQQDGRDAVRLPFPVDPVAAARALAATGEAWCWFDGAAAPAGEPRISYLAAGGEVRVAEAGREREFLAGLRPVGAPDRAGAAPPAPCAGFREGWAVALGYEFGTALMGLDPSPAPEPAPPAAAPAAEPAPAFALRAEAVLAVDHDTGVGEVRGPIGAVTEWLAAHGEALRSASAPQAGDAVPQQAGIAAPREPLARWRRSDDTYLADVEACRDAIREGDAYVLCLTDTAEARGAFDPLEVYLRLRSAGAAARGGLLVAGDRALVSASPERFLSLHGRRLSTHPIKGTRPRGRTDADDRALAEELRDDPKERAENLMIVDLMRNDLSRVCEPGTVAVDGFLRVETHPHVHQLVSTVSGEMLPGAGIAEAIGACFPGGSMTGAPKRRAVEILRELEGAPRSLYSGCFGWIDGGGDAELAMTIRGIELRGAGGRFDTALLGAGGGITADSDPSREVAEKHLKAASLVAALYP